MKMVGFFLLQLSGLNGEKKIRDRAFCFLLGGFCTEGMVEVDWGYLGCPNDLSIIPYVTQLRNFYSASEWITRK